MGLDKRIWRNNCKTTKKLGCSADWSRARFTMDEGLSKAVLVVFKNCMIRAIYIKAKDDKLVPML